MRFRLNSFIFALIFLVAGCISDKTELRSLTTNTVMLTVGAAPGAFDRIILSGNDVNGSNAFAKFYTSAPGQVELELVPSGWTFYAIAYNGGNLIGCGDVVVNNQKTKKFATLNLSLESCADSHFLGPDPTLNQANLPAVSWSPTQLEFCETVGRVTSSNDICTDLLTDGSRKAGRGNIGSYKFTLMEYERSGTTVNVTGPGSASACQLGRTTDVTSLRNLSSTFLTNILPAGNGTTTPFYVKMELYPDELCAATPNIVNLYHGVVSDSTDAKYVTKAGAPSSRKLYVKYDGDGVCQGTQLSTDFAGGNGNLSTPYLICNATQLFKIFPLAPAAYVSMASAHYKLQSDIDLSAITVGAGGNTHPAWEGCVAPGSNFMPIGTSAACVITAVNNGSFDGAGKKISGLKISSSGTRSGLYGEITNISFEIRRLHLDSAQITNTNLAAPFTGAFLGLGYNFKLTELTLTNSSITGKSGTGGFVGQMQGGSIRHAKGSNNSVTGVGDTGGIIGRGIWSGTATTKIYDSYTSGTVVGTSNSVGGIAGTFGTATFYSEIQSSRFKGNVQGPNSAGGLVGTGQSLRIENSYAHAKVITTQAVALTNQGGLIGSHQSRLLTTGIFTSYYYNFLGMDLGWSCLAGTACRIGNVVGNTGDYISSDYDTAVYANTLSTMGFNTLYVGQPQTDASFYLAYPGWLNGATDITGNFSTLYWNFVNGQLPSLLIEE